jgi:hypothetical protein
MNDPGSAWQVLYVCDRGSGDAPRRERVPGWAWVAVSMIVIASLVLFFVWDSKRTKCVSAEGHPAPLFSTQAAQDEWDRQANEAFSVCPPGMWDQNRAPGW